MAPSDRMNSMYIVTWVLLSVVLINTGLLHSQSIVTLPAANNEVNAIAISGNIIYIGGGFTAVGDSTRSRLAAIDASTGTVTGWNPNVGIVSGTPWVYALAVSGSTVYAGGNFTKIGDSTRNKIAAIDASTGVATSWNPNVTGLDVRALAISGSTVFVGGQFTVIGDSARKSIAALNSATGKASKWNPNPSASGSPVIYALYTDGSLVLAGGFFSNIGGSSRNNLAMLDMVNGSAYGWNPNADDRVYAFAAVGMYLYAGGSFSHIGDSVRFGFAQIEPGSPYNATSWQPGLAVGSKISALAASSTTIYAVGSFSVVGDSSRHNMVAFNPTTKSVTRWDPNANSTVDALALDFSNKQIYAGGLFTSVLGTVKPYFVALRNTDDAELPVELVSFTAIGYPSAGKNAGAEVGLRWMTATEVNNYGFEIERQQPGFSGWKKIGFVTGNGTSNSPHSYEYVDQVQPGNYAYRLKQINLDGTFAYSYESEVVVGAPSTLALSQNHPNPFNPSTFISYEASSPGTVSLRIHNVIGQEVMTLVNEARPAGRYTERFDGGGLPSGIYYAKLTVGGRTMTIKMTLMK